MRSWYKNTFSITNIIGNMKLYSDIDIEKREVIQSINIPTLAIKIF